MNHSLRDCVLTGKIKQNAVQKLGNYRKTQRKWRINVQLYGLKNCDTCRKAMKNLPDAALIDVRLEGVPEDVLTAAFEVFGAALLNTRSTTWRGLDETERQGAPLDLLALHPTLMKRPLIVDGDKMYLGFAKDVQAALGAT